LFKLFRAVFITYSTTLDFNFSACKDLLLNAIY